MGTIFNNKQRFTLPSGFVVYFDAWKQSTTSHNEVKTDQYKAVIPLSLISLI
jgi:hypothetical protein